MKRHGFLKAPCAVSPFDFSPSRYIVLDNGLRALLISDYSGPAASEDQEEDGEEEEEEEEEEEGDESGDETEDESEEDDEDDGYDEDDDEGKKKKGNAEKQVPLGGFLM